MSPTAAACMPAVRRRSLRCAPALLAALSILSTGAAAQLGFSPPQFLPGDAADGLTDGHQPEANIAAGGDGFLAVWSDARSSLDDYQGLQGSGYDIFGALLDADGNVVLRSLVINEGPGNQSVPCAAWNGEHWLVAWVEPDPVGLPTYDRIRGVRVAADGTLVDATPIVIHEDDYYFSYEGPAMASAGADGWAVVVPANDLGLRAVRVASDGTVTTPPDGVTVNPASQLNFDIVFAQDEYMIVHSDNPYPRARRYSPTLQLLGSTTLPFADKVATDGTNFLIVDTNYNLWPPALQGLMLNHGGAMTVSPFTIKTGTAVTEPNGVGTGFDGTNYWVTWGGNQFARVTPSGQLLDPGGFTISPSVTATFGYLPAYDTAPNGGLQMLWNDGGGGAGYPIDAYTARVTTAGTVINETPATISAPAQVDPDFARGAGTNLLVFSSRTSGAARILAQRLDDNGLALDSEPIEVASGPVEWLDAPSIDAPQAAWNGSVFMVVWSDTINVLARRMNPDGTFVDAIPLVIMPGRSTTVGALGTTFLVGGSVVGYSSGTLQPPGALRVSRVDGVTGAVLDSPPITVGGASDRHPHIVTLGGRWLVVWEAVTYDPWSTSVFYAAGVVFVEADGTTTGQLATELSRRPNVAVAGDRALLVAVDGSVPGGYTDLEARILMADGTFLGPVFPLSTAPFEQLSPAAGWNGTEFIVAWEDQRNAVSYFDKRTDIYGTRVSPTGVVRDPAGVALATSSHAEIAPAFLSVGGTSLMAVSTLRSDTPLSTYRLGIQRHEPGGLVCQTDLGFGGPGVAELQMCGGALASGGTADILLSGAPAQTLTWLVLGSTLSPTALFGGLVVPVPPTLVLAFTTDAGGQLFVPDVQGGVGPLTLYLQAVVLDAAQPQGFGISNALQVDFLP